MRWFVGFLVVVLDACSIEVATRDAGVDAGQDDGGAFDAGVDAGEDTVPLEIASRQTVRFEVHNDGGQSLYVLDSANRLCDPVPIERNADAGWEPLPLRIANPRRCGLADDIFGYSLSFSALQSGDTLSLEWDARELTLFQQHVCPPVPNLTDLRGVLQPSPPGEYRARICFQKVGQGSGGYPVGLNIPCACTGVWTIVPFTLPDDGGVVIEVVAPVVP